MIGSLKIQIGKLLERIFDILHGKINIFGKQK